jgi:hypothetical protein
MIKYEDDRVLAHVSGSESIPLLKLEPVCSFLLSPRICKMIHAG